MKKIFFGHIIAALLLTLTTLSEVYAQGKALTIYVDSSYPPYMYKLGKAKAEGLYPRLLRETLSGFEYEANVLAIPWKRALLYGETGIGAVGGAYKNDERLEIYDFSAPLYQEKMVIFVNKANSFEYNSIEDLAGKTIGVNRGWSYGQKFDAAREAKLFEVNIRNNPQENFKMLALGRIDCLILDQLSGESYIQLLGIADNIVSLPIPFSMNNGYLIISKELNMRDFLDKFNTSLEELREKGSYHQIVQQFVRGTISKKLSGTHTDE